MPAPLAGASPPHPVRRAARGWKYVAIAVAVLILAPSVVAYSLLRASLPQLDGTIHSPSLSAPVRIDRDDLGVPTIEAANRTDLAYGTGFVHGQDRFFEMDLSRRLAAGELSELVGKAALEQDESARIFRFRQVAQASLRLATAEQRAAIEAYARGVNDGLASLGARPWEYLLLGSAPARWLPEDSILVVHAMWWQLQYLGFHREMLRHEVNERLGGPLCGAQWKCALSFFYPARTEWDAPAVGASAAQGNAPPRTEMPRTEVPPQSEGAGIPTPDVLDLRRSAAGPPSAHVALRSATVGSNNWAVAGAYTTTGSALVANDMHLGQRVPVIWYHARLKTAASAGGPGIDLNGVTLPGAPVMVAGSNGHIAWGFTNSYGKWLDVELVPCSGVGEAALQGPSGRVALSVQWEQIRVHGEAAVRFPIRSGPAGLLLEAHPERGQCWFGTWLARLPAASNFNLMSLERVSTTQEALALAPSIGIPHQNFVVGDREGHIGWAIFGRIPSAVGSQRADGRSTWMAGSAHPSALDPPAGRIWTANARVTSDPAQELAIGAETASLGSEYDLGARAGQIRDDLLAIGRPATPADMLRVQLDDRAVFLARWRDLLLGLLDADSLKNQPRREEFRQLVAGWDAAAGTGSVGYRLVRAWHERTEAQVWDMILDGLHIPADESYSAPAQFEGPLWRLLREQPLHLLPSRYASWRDFLLAQLDATIAGLEKDCGSLGRCSWGLQNTLRIRHPLSRSLPFLSGLLDMPVLQMPGDHDMPRVQGPTFGASERFAVSPGHEAQGYLHMPGGQSGHPLSPYYRAGFLEWARGAPLPFLPGVTRHTQILTPR